MAYEVSNTKNATDRMEDIVAPSPPPAPPVVQTQPTVFKTHRETFMPALVHFAVNNGNLEELQSLAAKGINLDYRMHCNTPLFLAILKEQYSMAQCLVAEGANVHITEQSRWLRQPIHLAAEAGHLDLVKQLLHHGASVHAADATLRTPLHCAAYEGHGEVVDFLLEEGAHVNCKDDSGRTPLFRAVERNDCDIVDALASSGAVINTRDKFNWTPLFHSIVCGHSVMINHLLSNYIIDIDAQSVDGDTALHLALSRTRYDRMDVLTSTGVDFYMRSVQAPTPAVHRAINTEPCCEMTVKMLIDYGCNLNLRNRQGDTPFQLASRHASNELLLHLISAGVDMSQEESWLREEALPLSLIQQPEFLEHLKSMSKIKISNLKEICRLVVRHSLRPFIHSKIQKLPLPSSLQQYMYASSDNQPVY